MAHTPAPTAADPRPRLGVSACLLGQQVRFDGGHKRDPWLADVAARCFELVPFCPEAEIGLGTPRASLQLRRVAGELQLVNGRAAAAGSAPDYRDAMRDLAGRRAAELGDLDGLVVKKGSPSCGMERVPVVVTAAGPRERNGAGVFTAELRRRLPLVPVEEEGRLQDPLLREVFLERVYALHRWRCIPDPERNLQGFVEFHARHKLLLMARGPQLYAELGRIVAGVTRASLAERRDSYIHRFMAVMALRPDRPRQINVLQHILGFLKRGLDRDDKQALLALFEAYREGRLSLIGPLLLLQHHLRRLPHPWLASQYYLAPFPAALAPRHRI
jgi:uncharacterized protein YbgA (DUF1722 family)/uncharacterized protein YbbK (DUF523 family)